MSASVEVTVPARSGGTGRQSTLALAAAMLGFFVITLDAVVVNVALASVRREFGSGITGLQWVVDGYTLMFAALLLWSGALADRIGARRAFGVGMALFVVASVGCGAAPTLGMLIAARFVQGAAAAVMMPSSMALLGHAFPDPVRRARAVALWAMGGAAASSSGPVLGGVLTTVSWRLIFLLNVPVGVVSAVLLARLRPSPHRRVPFDWVGQASAVTAMAALTYGAIEAGAAGFGALHVMVAFVVAIVAVTLFVATESRVAHPMVPLELLRVREVRVAIAVGFAFVVGYYGLPFVMSLYLQQVRGLSPFRAGLVFLPMMLVGAVLTPFVPRVVERLGARAVVTSGLVIMITGLVATGMVSEATPVPVVGLLMMIVGLAGPFMMPPIMAVLLNSVSDDRAGTASGVFNTGRQIGGALAIAVFGALIGSGSFLRGLRTSFLIAAAVCALAAAATLTLRSA